MCRRARVSSLLFVILMVFGNSYAKPKTEYTISVEQIHANHPKIVSKKQCKQLFTPGLFSALSRTEKTVITSPDKDMTIGPRTRRIAEIDGAKYLLTSFVAEFNSPVRQEKKPKKTAAKKKTKSSSGIDNSLSKRSKTAPSNQKKPVKKAKKKQKQDKEEGGNTRKLGPDTAQSYFIAPLDNSRRGFLSTVYCDAVLKMTPK